jgi:predicted HicB family RNase H-like nuclease
MANAKKTSGAGRPPLPKGDAKAKIVPVRFKPEEFKAMASAARASKQTLSEWIRGALNAKLANSPGKCYIKI